jgi:hypothetical protein
MSFPSWVTVLSLTLLISCTASAEEPVAKGVTDGKPIVEKVDFERHVGGLFRRLGCNAGACHGSFEGKGGFRLSLFGQSPAQDFAAIAGDSQTCRVVSSNPEKSLILAKPAKRVDHAGGLRMPQASWEYALVRQWISEGANYTLGTGQVRRLVTEPGPTVKLASGESLSVKIAAEFVDGTTDLVTCFSEFRSTDESVAVVDAKGSLTAAGPGSASVVASYNGAFANLSVIVPFPQADHPSSTFPAINLIDIEVDRRLNELKLSVSPSASDSDFLRRATLDVLGTVPTVDDVRDFNANPDPAKRIRAIDRLLSHPRRAAVWASKMCDVTACNIDTMESPESLRPKRAKMWHDWFRRRFADNVPYDQVARNVLCATSRHGEPVDRWIESEAARETAAERSFDSDYATRPTLDLFWRRMGPGGAPPVEDLVELTASAFLGLRLHCARCHHHPYDQWSQRDFAGLAQIFARVQFGGSSELRTEVNRQLAVRRQQRGMGVAFPTLPRLQEVYVGSIGRPLIDAAIESSAPPTALGGPVVNGSPDPRNEFAVWLTQPANRFFAKSFVNRIWAKYFGLGLVEPVDDMSASNPARNSALLDRLAEEFASSGYDVMHIERLILSSNAYQRSAYSLGNNAASTHDFARFPVRSLPAETLIDAVNAALETADDFGSDVPSGATAHEVAPNRLAGSNFNTVFRLLGRGDRRSLCDCDRAARPSIRQPIFLMSDQIVQTKIAKGRLARLMEAGSDDRAIVTELYRAMLSRIPDETDMEFLLNQISNAKDRGTAFIDIVWAILNTREFSTNH